MSAVLTLSSVTKRFGGLAVIDDVSFAIGKGSRSALIGPNGAGKTTIFNLLSGIYDVNSGRMFLDGADITHVPARDRINFGMSRSFQNIRLMPHLSTVENVMLGQHHLATSFKDIFYPLALRPKNKWAEQARASLSEAGLDTYAGQVVSELPYGVQKRIEVVRALMSDPKLLLLDEPAAGLNAAEANELQALLEKVSSSGTTLLVVEHDMNFVRNLCQNVVVLNFGRKIFEGTPEEVGKDPQVLEAYLGGDASDAA
jgi:branched-chain amino acid transport system ATP-binding protein